MYRGNCLPLSMREASITEHVAPRGIFLFSLREIKHRPIAMYVNMRTNIFKNEILWKPRSHTWFEYIRLYLTVSRHESKVIYDTIHYP